MCMIPIPLQKGHIHKYGDASPLNKLYEKTLRALRRVYSGMNRSRHHRLLFRGKAIGVAYRIVSWAKYKDSYTAYSTSSTSFVDINSYFNISITLDDTADIITTFIMGTRVDPGLRYPEFRVVRDGTQIAYRQMQRYRGDAAEVAAIMDSFVGVEKNVAAGTYTIKPQWKINTGNITCWNQSFLVLAVYPGNSGYVEFVRRTTRLGIYNASWTQYTSLTTTPVESGKMIVLADAQAMAYNDNAKGGARLRRDSTDLAFDQIEAPTVPPYPTTYYLTFFMHHTHTVAATVRTYYFHVRTRGAVNLFTGGTQGQYGHIVCLLIPDSATDYWAEYDNDTAIFRHVGASYDGVRPNLNVSHAIASGGEKVVGIASGNYGNRDRRGTIYFYSLNHDNVEANNWTDGTSHVWGGSGHAKANEINSNDRIDAGFGLGYQKTMSAGSHTFYLWIQQANAGTPYNDLNGTYGIHGYIELTIFHVEP